MTQPQLAPAILTLSGLGNLEEEIRQAVEASNTGGIPVRFYGHCLEVLVVPGSNVNDVYNLCGLMTSH
jgi:hypothetical protein